MHKYIAKYPKKCYYIQSLRGKENNFVIILFAFLHIKGEDNIEEKYYKIWITLIPKLGVKRYLNLIKRLKNNKNIFNASYNELKGIELINNQIIQEILNVKHKQTAKNHLKYIICNKIEIISILDKNYPLDLKNTYNPPICIYIKGNQKIFELKSIAIIGCRDCTKYGIEMAKEFSYKLAKNNINIVSGLARGIDSYAHFGAICANGITTAVLGNGLDTIYPKENYNLAQKIIEKNGAIISEYPIGTKPEKMNFPARNRIISGIAKGVLVIEAKQKSGTLITVDLALEQGKEVFVIPR